MTRSTWTKALSAEMNVTPRLDVLLVLLVIFMAVPQARKTIDAQLSVPCPGACRGNGASIVLEVLPGPGRGAVSGHPSPTPFPRHDTHQTSATSTAANGTSTSSANAANPARSQPAAGTTPCAFTSIRIGASRTTSQGIQATTKTAATRRPGQRATRRRDGARSTA